MVSRFADRFVYFFHEFQNRSRVKKITRQIAAREIQKKEQKPVVFFNASTRVKYISLNAAFSSIAAWGFRLSGTPVVHFACKAGMSRCVLGSDPDNHRKEPPCKGCIAQSRRLFAHTEIKWFEYKEHNELSNIIGELSIKELTNFVYEGKPLGQIVLPSIRWRMRRHHLLDDDPTRFLFREFIHSGYWIGIEFAELLEQVDPLAVFVFNGMMFPEAMACRVARERNIPVITHEIGYQPFTGFFTTGEATERLVHVPDSYDLTEKQNALLDDYLEKRFEGQFSMGGIKFWQDMRGLDESFMKKAEQFKQIVPIFTNVIFDSSQPHANVVFEHMFEWLDLILEIIKTNPETLFVIRAHPDEMRPDSKKKSRETVRQWVQKNKVEEFPNLLFIDSLEYISSYALIQNSKFVMVYNSSIGLEGTLLGVPVISGGEAWYTHYPTVFFPNSPQVFRKQVQEFLSVDKIDLPDEFLHNARRLVYHQNFNVPLPFSDFLENHGYRGYVKFKSFPIDLLYPENSPAVNAIQKGLFDRRRVFSLDDVS